MDRTKGRTAAAAGFCLALALILLTVAATVYNMAGDRSLLAIEMRRHSDPRYSGLPDERYPEMGKLIADYLTGRVSIFQFYFTDDEGNLVVAFHAYESDHMEDCRRIIRWTGRLRWILGGAALILIGTGIFMRGYRKKYSTGILAGLGFSAGIFILVLAWGIINFDSLFTIFHRLLFTNDGWLLDTRTDLLIRLMPTSFFISMGTKVVLAVAAVAMACFTTVVMIRLIGNKEEEQDAAVEQ